MAKLTPVDVHVPASGVRWEHGLGRWHPYVWDVDFSNNRSIELLCGVSEPQLMVLDPVVYKGGCPYVCDAPEMERAVCAKASPSSPPLAAEARLPPAYPSQAYGWASKNAPSTRVSCNRRNRRAPRWLLRIGRKS